MSLPPRNASVTSCPGLRAPGDVFALLKGLLLLICVGRPLPAPPPNAHPLSAFGCGPGCCSGQGCLPALMGVRSVPSWWSCFT